MCTHRLFHPLDQHIFTEAGPRIQHVPGAGDGSVTRQTSPDSAPSTCAAFVPRGQEDDTPKEGCEETGREVSTTETGGEMEEAALSFSEHVTRDLGPQRCQGVRNRGRRVSEEGAGRRP